MSGPESNTLGKASLGLGIASIVFVFGLGMCAALGGAQVPGLNSVLLVCAASSAFLGLIGAFLGLGGLFGRNRSRAAATFGLLLGLGGVCLFLTILNSLG